MIRRREAEQAGRLARRLVDACLGNNDIQELIADADTPYTEDKFRADPVCRVDFDEVYVIGTIAEGLSVAKSKAWGAGPRFLPLSPEDPVDAIRILYVHKPNSRHRRRFEQRERLKELLGRGDRSLVTRAKYSRNTKRVFLESLTEEEQGAIKRIPGVADAGQFWRACRGRTFLALPPRWVQLELF